MRAKLGVFLALALIGAPSTRAADRYWDNDGGTLNDWGSSANWSTIPGPADVAVFSAASVTTQQTVNLNAARAVSGLRFTSAQSHSLLGGNANQTLTLGTSGITVDAGAGAATIGSAANGQNVSITLAGTQSWSNNSTNPLTVVNGVTNGGFSLTLTGTGNAALDGAIGGTGGLTKSGSGTATLAGANTYSGVTAISAGTLKLGSASALGTTAGNTALSGGTLDLNGQTVGNEAIVFSGTSALVNNSTTPASLSGAISGLQNSTSIGGSGNLTLSGTVDSTGNNGWEKVGTGTLILTGANTFNRGVNIIQGVVNIQNDTALGDTPNNSVVVSTGAALEMQGDITSNSKPLRLNGTGLSNDGALRNISGANTYSQPITLGSAGVRINSDSGTLTLGSTTAISGATFGLTFGGAGDTRVSSVIGTTTGTLTKDGAGTLTLSGANTYTGVTTIAGGTLSVATIGNGGVAGNLGQATNVAANLVLGGGTLQYTGATASTDRNFTLSTGTTSTFDITTNNLTISGASTATTGGLTKLGAGTLTLTGANAYTGLTDVQAGTLAYGANNALAGGAVTVSGGTLDIKTYSDAVGAVTLTSGTIAGSGGVLTGTSYAVQSGAISAILGGSAALTKTTAGTVTLSGVNTYTGLTDVQAGTLAYGANNALAGGAVTVSGGTLDIKTYSDAVGAVTLTSGTIAGSGGVLTGTSYAVQSGAISAILGGSAALTKSTAGTVTLSGVNTYTGRTDVQAGTLAYGVTNALAGGAVTVSGGNLDITTYSDTVGAVTLTSGSITGTTGVLTGTSYSLTNTGSVSAILGGGNTVTVTKAGAGTVFLTGANTYQGETTFTSGIVNVATLSNYGVAGSLGSRLEIDEKSGGNSTNVSMHFMGGTLQYTGSTAQSTDRGIRVGLAGGTIDASGSVPSATMNFTKSTTNVDVWDTDGGRMLTLTGSNTGNNIFAINWQERAAGHSSLVKSGTGTWVLTNPHNSDGQTDAYNTYGGYGGGTTVSGGTLGFVNGAIGGGVVDFTGNATLRWESGNTQDLTTGTGAGVARSVKIEDGKTATFNTNGNNVTLSNALAVGPLKTGALTKDGAGILTLSANNTYDGATTVSAGTLVVNGNQAAANGAVSVSGTLAGTGTVGGATTINAGGTHAPGAVGAVGKQNFSGNLHYAAGSIFEWDLNDNSTSMGFDMVGAGGDVIVDTSSTVFRIVFGPLVNMSDSFWSTPWVTRKWAMSSIFGKAISGAFQSVDTGGYPVNPIGTFSIDNGYLYYTTVPEPTGALAGLLLGAGLLRRRRLATSERNMRRRPKAVVIDTPAA